MMDWRSSLEKCFCGEPFCWNQKPEELFCWIVRPRDEFKRGDTLYKYNREEAKWEVECDGSSGGCKEGCLVHAVQQKDPQYMDRIYYTVGNIERHYDHHEDMKEIKKEQALIKEEKEVKRSKCSYASRYKAKRKPTCGCETCEFMWKNSPHNKDN